MARQPQSEPVDVRPEELQAALQHIRAGRPPRLVIASVADLLKAVELGVIDKAEARKLLGFQARRGGAAARQTRGPGGRFARQQRASSG